MIIDRYLQRELLAPFLGVLGVLSALFVVFLLARFLADASAGLLEPSEVLRVAALRWVIAQEVLLPIALYLGLIMALGRLYQDHEIEVLRAAGLSEARIWLPMFRLALLLALLVAAVSIWGRPWAYQQADRIEAEARAAANIDRISAQQFNNWGNGGWTVFIESRARDGSRDNLKGVFIRRRDSSGLDFISAPSGHLETFVAPDYHELRLREAVVYREFIDRADFSGRFQHLTLAIPAKQSGTVDDRPKTRSLGQLGRSGTNEDLAERQWRLSTGVNTLLLAVLAFQLSRSSPRQGRFIKVLFALGIFAVYFNLIGMARNWVEQGSAPFIWWVPGLLMLLCGALEARARGFGLRRR